MHRIYTGICVVCGLLLVAGMPAAAWTADMDVTTGTVTFDLTYGVEPNTTAQVDDNVDKIVPPPVPGMTKCAYFVLPEGIFRELSTDIRPEPGWEMYVNSDEDASLTWSHPPVTLYLTIVTVTGGDVLVQDAVNMDAQQSISLTSGTHYITIDYEVPDSGSSANPAVVKYQPPVVVTGTQTSKPTDTPVPQTPVPTDTLAETTLAPPATETAAPAAVPVATGSTQPGMTVAVPANTTSPTQSPVSAIIPLTGVGIFLVFYLRKQ